MDTKTRSAKRKLFVAVVVVCFIVASPFALLALYQSPFVYYRHFNRIKAKLEVLPDTKIVDSWQHQDITLEDFGFDLRVRQCPPIRLDFYEGGDWYRDFGAIDGIIFSKPYNPATNDYETTRISCDELAQAGIRVRNLTDVVSQLEAVLTYLKARPQRQPDVPRAGAYYIRIYYDLDAYKKTQSAA
jgi:hypothetical protein